MSLLAKIQTDRLTARKSRHAVNTALLTTLYAEAAAVGLNDGKRESTDEEVVMVVTKFAKNVREFLDMLPETESAGESGDVLRLELDIYNTYLPTQLTEEELTTVVVNMIEANDFDNMGQVMKELKTHFDGEYDGRLAANIIKVALSD